MGSTKWTYYDEWSFVSNHIVLKNLFHFLTVASETHWKENILFNLKFCLILKILV